MGKKCAVLFSGGKDSCLALYLAKLNSYDIVCLVTLVSENLESFMFHTLSIMQVKKQAEVMGIPLLFQKTKGKKENELKDLEIALLKAKERRADGVVTGAVESVYQASRIQKICNKLDLECFNPLWQKNQFEILEELLKKKFKVIVTGVFAHPFNKRWLGKKIDKMFIEEMKELNKKYKINPAGEGGEFESLVLD